MRPLQKGEAKSGMTVYAKDLSGREIPYHVLGVQDRGSYDMLCVSKKSKSGKINKNWGTGGHDDFLI